MLATLAVLASLTIITMMSPGPDMLLIINYAMARSRLPALACVAGICAGLSVHISLSIFGVAALIAASTTLFTLIKVVGALYLIYLGIKSFSASAQTLVPNSQSLQVAQPSLMNAFRAGMLCNMLNPKATLFILAVFTQLVEVETSVLDKIAYGAFILTLVLVVWGLFAMLIRTGPVLNLLQKYQLVIDKLVGGFLVLIGAGLIAEDTLLSD